MTSRMNRPALLIFNLQDDFLSPDGILGDDYIRAKPWLPHLERLAQLFAANGFPIIVFVSQFTAWKTFLLDLTRDYGTAAADLPQSLERSFITLPRLTGTLSKKGRHFREKYGARIRRKTVYNCFADHTLQNQLRQQEHVGTGPLYFAGVHADGCIKVSMDQAIRLGYQVFAIKEAICAIPESLTPKFLKSNEDSTVSADDIIISTAHSPRDPPQLSLIFDSTNLRDRTVILCLASMGTKYQPRQLSAMTRLPHRHYYHNAPQEFLDNNPQEQTPVLIKEDGTKLVGQHAVIYYLLSRHGIDARSLPRIVLQCYQESEVLLDILSSLWSLPSQERSDFLVATVHKLVISQLARWERDRRLQNAHFAATNEISVADIVFYPILEWVRDRGVSFRVEGFPQLDDYCRRIESMAWMKEVKVELRSGPKWFELYKLNRDLWEEQHAFIQSAPCVDLFDDKDTLPIVKLPRAPPLLQPPSPSPSLSRSPPRPSSSLPPLTDWFCVSILLVGYLVSSAQRH